MAAWVCKKHSWSKKLLYTASEVSRNILEFLTVGRFMSAKAIREATGKDLINKNLGETKAVKCRFVQIGPESKYNELLAKNSWMESEKLVAKPDQLIKRRGKLGLVIIDKTFSNIKQWIQKHMNQVQKVGAAKGKLKHFIVEPYVPHNKDEEMYVCIYTERHADSILFHKEGGIDVGDVDKKAQILKVSVGEELVEKDIVKELLAKVPEEKKEMLKKFILELYKLFVKLHFTYLEINPLVVKNSEIHILDLAAKLDSTADFLCKPIWGDMEFPPPFGRDAIPEEAYIADLDSKTGASLKLTVLNKTGRIWTMIAGGGASVVYSDTIVDLGGAGELANYGEYSGDPTEQLTYEYAKTILSLMTQEQHPKGKILIIGGGIANFTNVAKTFHGIIRALLEYREKLKDHNTSIFVRRAGPNYQEGLRRMREVGHTLGIPLYVFGPETHMTAIVGMAFGTRPIPQDTGELPSITDSKSSKNDNHPKQDCGNKSKIQVAKVTIDQSPAKKTQKPSSYLPLFHSATKAIVWGMQNRAVQSMLDFDYICRRKQPSVVGIINPFTGSHMQKYFWGAEEVFVPVYKEMKKAMNDHADADVMVNFASLRSAYSCSIECLDYPQIKTIAIIAEGIPENHTRKLIKLSNQKKVIVIGPATVGGIKSGCFKIGNTAGLTDNILESKLYRPGSVAYVSKSGGLSNELNNIIAKTSDGVYEGVAVGGDRYPGSTFLDHILRYQTDDNVKMIVVLGEVGGIDEYDICDAMKNKVITKPLVAWCIGTCVQMFQTEVQFGHAGSSAATDKETAIAKNKAFKEAGAHVPTSFDQLGDIIYEVYKKLFDTGIIEPTQEFDPPSIPMDFNWAKQLGLVRKPSNFISTISDDRGQEVIYAGMPITDVLDKNIGIGGVMSLLWFKKCLPQYVCKYLEMCLMVTADHGPAVSGAHNTIICSRAGKDMVSSLVSGLLTIGERFGGAMDGAAKMFSEAYDTGMTPTEFVNSVRQSNKLILGIGHRIKSVNNPDHRVSILKDYIFANFPPPKLLNYALEVEKITTGKRPNLILNIDGVIGVTFVDMLRTCGHFSKEEAHDYIHMGVINSIFVVGRSIGFIGHYIDQKRLKQGMYRHAWDDISYVLPKVECRY